MNCFKFTLVAFVFLISGCAIGPLVSHESARTVGEKNTDLTAGFGTSSFVLKWNYGLTQNLDIGLQFEELSFGVRAKYAFVNADKGWSYATALGAGESLGGNHKYIDLMASYMNEKWEPYSTLRIVYVETDPSDFKDQNTGTVDFTVNSTTYSYGQFIFGTKYWLSKHWLWSLEASSLFTLTSDFQIGSNLLVGGAFSYKF